jgi:cytochrome c-type biogenesis protein CcmH/NrfG
LRQDEGINDFAESLARLEEQRGDGQITDEEYFELRAHLLEQRDKSSKRLTVRIALVALLVVIVVIVATL